MNRVVLVFCSLFIFQAIFTTGCKTEFEKVRVSGDTELIYKEAFAFYEGEKYQKAQTLFELLIPAYRGKKELEKIYFTYSYTYYFEGKYILAAYYFKNFATTFPKSELREEAEFMSAYSNYEMSPGYRLEQTYTEKAISELQLFTNTYPESERVKDANGLIDEMRKKQEQKAYAVSELYFDLRQYQAAVHTFENLLKDFPDTKRGEQIRYMIVKASFLLAENSVVEKQDERYNQVKKYAEEYLRKYPKASNKKEVTQMLDKSINKIKIG